LASHIHLSACGTVVVSAHLTKPESRETPDRKVQHRVHDTACRAAVRRRENILDRTRPGSDAYLLKQTDFVAQLTYPCYTCNPKVIPFSRNHSDPETNGILSHFGLRHLSSGDSRFGIWTS